MESGDIIYLVLMVIFLLSGLLKKKKKADRKGTAQTMPFPTMDDMENDDDRWFAEEDEKTAPFYEKKDLASPTPVYQSDRDAAEHGRIHTQVLQQVKQRKKEKDIAANNQKNTTEDSYEQIELNTAEEAQKAFIYSEIFQRKY